MRLEGGSVAARPRLDEAYGGGWEGLPQGQAGTRCDTPTGYQSTMITDLEMLPAGNMEIDETFYF